MFEVYLVLLPPGNNPPAIHVKNKEKAQEMCDFFNKERISASRSCAAEVFTFQVYEDDEIKMNTVEESLK